VAAVPRSSKASITMTASRGRTSMIERGSDMSFRNWRCSGNIRMLEFFSTTARMAASVRRSELVSQCSDDHHGIAPKRPELPKILATVVEKSTFAGSCKTMEPKDGLLASSIVHPFNNKFQDVGPGARKSSCTCRGVHSDWFQLLKDVLCVCSLVRKKHDPS
jgi:hypothetical protein